MRLIDADALLQRAVPHGWSTPLWVSDIMIEDAPTIEAVEVIRCKDCRYGYCDKLFYFNDSYRCNIHDDGFEIHDADWYCPDGKRKEE